MYLIRAGYQNRTGISTLAKLHSTIIPILQNIVHLPGLEPGLYFSSPLCKSGMFNHYTIDVLKWSMTDLNRRPHAYKACTLTTELKDQFIEQVIGIEPTLFLVGSQMHHHLCVTCILEPRVGFEPTTY